MSEKIAGHVVICTPLYELVPVPSFSSFITAFGSAPKLFGKLGFSSTRGTYLQIARRKIAEDVLNRDKEGPVEFLLWIDSDMVFSVENISMLFLAAKQHNADLMSAFYVTKREPISPVFYFEKNGGYESPKEVDKKYVFEVDGVGFGFLLMKMSALKKVAEKYGVAKAFHVIDPFNGEDLGEDLVFCKLAKKEGLKICVDTNNLVGHWGGTITPDKFFKTQK
ncbi:MAG: hypothetical protein HYW50_00610 [Candidatus Diapherotrites archaeon]|nr:hypothetical protein [Candidatus Diapherotrites archaeon]